MKTFYVINSVSMDGKIYNSGDPIDCDETTAKHLLKAKAVTVNKPEKQTSEVKEEKTEEFVNPFTEIELEDKHAKLLILAGFSDMEKLGEAKLEQLEVIQGISKKLAKEIASCFGTK